MRFLCPQCKKSTHNACTSNKCMCNCRKFTISQTEEIEEKKPNRQLDEFIESMNKKWQLIQHERNPRLKPVTELE